MADYTKEEKRMMTDLLRKGILHRHAQWQQEMKALLNSPIPEGENEFDRSMEITKLSRDFYKEAMNWEGYYRTTLLLSGLRFLFQEHHLTKEDIAPLPEPLRHVIIS